MTTPNLSSVRNAAALRQLESKTMTLSGKPHILVIDDDNRLRELISRFLREQDFLVTTAASAEEARHRLEGMQFDMLVVDVMMPGESGLDLVRDLKSSGMSTPCLMLTAMGEPGQRLHGLESGADDYMTKPFEPLELALRMKNILGRRQGSGISLPHSDAMVPFGPHHYDLGRQLLVTGGQRRHLTSSEKALLSCFCENAGKVLSREQLSRMLGGKMEGRSIDVAVARLRRKLEPNPGRPIYLITMRGLGWVLETDTSLGDRSA